MNPLKDIARMQGLEMQQVAERLGMTRQNISSKVNLSGIYSMKVGFINEFLRACEVDYDQVTNGNTIRYSVYVGGEVVNFTAVVDLDGALVTGVEG
jgi:transcriptional regulator with XRE-family HTH domain